MNSASGYSLVALFLVCGMVDSKYFYENVKMYGCRCLQKDQTSQLLNSLTDTIPINANRPIWKFQEPSTLSIASNLHSKIQYLKQWLSNIALDPIPTVPPPTTTTAKPPTVDFDPVALPFDEGTGNSVFLRLAYKIMAKYFKKFRGEWTILDRFECVCDGNLVELLNSKTFINIQVAHD